MRLERRLDSITLICPASKASLRLTLIKGTKGLLSMLIVVM